MESKSIFEDHSLKNQNINNVRNENFKGDSNSFMTNIMRNLRITINRVHIRYEDDFFSLSPFACGILCDQVISCGSTTEWDFGSLENNKFKRIPMK